MNGLSGSAAVQVPSSRAVAHQPLALVHGRLVDGETFGGEPGGVLIIDGAIRDLGPDIAPRNLPSHARIIDCGGDFIAPGLIDMRAFVGEPGAEHRETIATATAAAAAGGVTTILARPDTHPPVDEPAVVDFLLRRARWTRRTRNAPSPALARRARWPFRTAPSRSAMRACCVASSPTPVISTRLSSITPRIATSSARAS